MAKVQGNVVNLQGVISEDGSTLLGFSDPTTGGDGVDFPAVGGSGGFVSSSFSTALAFDGTNKEMPQTAITGATAFTATGSTIGTQINLCLVANGTNIPTFSSSFKEATGSSGFDNTANVKNYYQFIYTNNKVIYSVFQEVGDTGASDITAPTLSSAVVQNATPTVVAVTYSEALDQTVTQNAADWAVSGHTVSSVAFASSTVINLTVDTFVYGEAARTVTYTNNANRVKDLAGNNAATSSATNITNNLAAPDVTAPTLTSATVENAAPTTLTLVFNEALDQTKVLSAADFTLSGSKSDSSPVYVNATTVSMTVTAFTNGEAITLDVAAGAVRDLAGNNLAAITARAITNNVAGSADKFVRFSNLNSVTETANGSGWDYLLNANGDYANTANWKIPANTDGYFEFVLEYATLPTGLSVSFHSTNTRTGYNAEFTLFYSVSGNYAVGVANNNPGATGVVPVTTHVLRIGRQGTTGSNVYYEYSTNGGASFTRQTGAYTYNGEMFPLLNNIAAQAVTVKAMKASPSAVAV